MENNKTRLKWKEKLVSSSFPLEYEAAKLLVKHGLSVTSDYTYSRADLGVNKDFSVDIAAYGYLPYKSEIEINSSIKILVECKQRKRSVSWLFLPDPNNEDLSLFTLGCTLHAVDEFSNKFFKPSSTIKLDQYTDLCYKGIEIDVRDGRVYDNEIRHGLHQLQYAMPVLLKNSIVSNISGHETDNFPFFFCSILLTTAKLFVANDNFSISKVENTSDVQEFAKEVPYLVTYLDTGPDFKQHCIRESKELSRVNLGNEKVRKISTFRKEEGEYPFNLPEEISQNLQNGSLSYQYFTQIIVCNMEHFECLIKEIKNISETATQSLKSQRYKT